jgi:hypothetical protein
MYCLLAQLDGHGSHTQQKSTPAVAISNDGSRGRTCEVTRRDNVNLTASLLSLEMDLIYFDTT